MQIRPLNGLIELMKSVLVSCLKLNVTGALAFLYKRSIAYQEGLVASETSTEYVS
jgi:hypothetical protein